MIDTSKNRAMRPFASRSKSFLTALLAFCFTSQAFAEEANNVLRGIEVREGNQTTEIAVQGTKPPVFTVFKLNDPPRLFIDVSGADASALNEPVEVENGVVSRITPLQFNDKLVQISRLIVSLENDAAYSVKAQGNELQVKIDASARHTLRPVASNAQNIPVAQPSVIVKEVVDPAVLARAEEAERNAALAKAEADAARAQVAKAQLEAEQAAQEAARLQKELEAGAQVEAARLAAERRAADAEARAQAAEREAVKAQAEAKRASDLALAAAEEKAAHAAADAREARAQAAKAASEAEQLRLAASISEGSAKETEAARLAAERRAADAEARASRIEAEAQRKLEAAQAETARLRSEVQKNAQAAALAERQAEDAAARFAAARAEAERLTIAERQAEEARQAAEARALAAESAKAQAMNKANAQLLNTETEAKEALARAEARALAAQQLAESARQAAAQAEVEAKSRAEAAERQAALSERESRARAEAAERELALVRSEAAERQLSARNATSEREAAEARTREAEQRAAQAVTAAEEREAAARAAEARAQEALARAREAEALALSERASALARAQEAENRAREAEVRAAQAQAQAQQQQSNVAATAKEAAAADARIASAEARAREAEARLQQAEMRAQEAERLARTNTQNADERARAAQKAAEERARAAEEALASAQAQAAAEKAHTEAAEARARAEKARADEAIASESAAFSRAEAAQARAEAAEAAQKQLAKQADAARSEIARLTDASLALESELQVAIAQNDTQSRARIEAERRAAEAALQAERSAMASLEAEQQNAALDAQTSALKAQLANAQKNGDNTAFLEKELARLESETAKLRKDIASKDKELKQARSEARKAVAERDAQRKAAKLAAQQSKSSDNAVEPTLARVTNVAFEDNDRQSRIRISLNGKAKTRIKREGERTRILELVNAQIDPSLERSLDTSDFNGAVRLVSSFQAPMPEDTVRIVVTLSEEVDDRISTQDGELTWSFARPVETPLLAQAVPYEEPKAAAYTHLQAPKVAQGDTANRLKNKVYTGRKINIDIKDGDIHNVLRLLAKEGNINIVTSDQVSGTVTLHLKMVPWDQVLDLVLKAKGLDMVREGDIVRIGRREDIHAEIVAQAEKNVVQEKLKPIKIRLVTASHASAGDLVARVRNMMTKERGTAEYDPRTNTIILKDTEDVLDSVEDMIHRLDTQTPEVLIEARIVEVNVVDDLNLGIQWGGDATFSSATGNATGLSFPSSIGISGGATDNQTPLTGVVSQPNFAVNLPVAAGTGNGGAIGFSFGSIDSAFNLNVRLSASESKGTAKIVSSPKITTLDNVEATISQGTSIPISQVSAAGMQTTFYDAVLRLTVKPTVTQDGNIYLKLKAENNSPDFQNVGARGDPTILKKEASTQLLLKDGDTTVIGGIYTSNSGESYSGVPFFASIPILGALFRNHMESDRRTELLIFVTPRIVNRSASTVRTSEN